MFSPSLNVPIFAALDVDSPIQALAVAEKVQTYVGGFKLGPRLTMRSSPSFMRDLSQILPVFLDFKFYDIPSTMEASVEAAFELGASFVTVHTSAGEKALERLSALQKQLSASRPFCLLGVTVLTSFSDNTLPAGWAGQSCFQLVQQLVESSFKAGLTGFVCSAEEAKVLRSKYPNAYLVTPGIRLDGESAMDQARVMTPSRALEMGASAIVVGRPICGAKDPALAARTYFEAVRT